MASGVRRPTKALVLHLSGSLRVKHGLLLILLSGRRWLLLIPTLLLLLLVVLLLALLPLPLLLWNATVGLL